MKNLTARKCTKIVWQFFGSFLDRNQPTKKERNIYAIYLINTYFDLKIHFSSIVVIMKTA